MRLTKIEFNGYKRLANTACNVDGKLIAFLGPNESGKSTVLECLTWLMSKDLKSPPLHRADRTRDLPATEAIEVARATFQLSSQDQKHMAFRYIDVPSTLTMYRPASGLIGYEFDDRRTALPSFIKRLRDALATVQAQLDGTRFNSAAVQEGLRLSTMWLRDSRLDTWDSDRRDTTANLIKMLRRLPPDVATTECAQLAAALELTLDSGPRRAVRRALLDLCPEFVLFSPSDRTLQTSYDLSGEDAAPSPALQNLLRLGGTSIGRLRSLLEEGNITLLRTALRKANSALRAKLQPSWRQSELTVELAVHGTLVQVLVNELDENGVTTSLDERSEGLRAFIALMAFLHDRTGPNLPVLLIDEAESKLHLDAQADLMEILQQQTSAGQILYTTHSLDCLPPDIGTGLRFVVPTSQHTSELRSNFWSSSKAGFRELHVMAGASRTAYSRFSRAVLTEGPSEMLLLPTLIRQATHESDLFYRVAPGLSNLRADSLELFDPADRTAYLLDGDDGGDTKKKQLIEAGMPADHVISLPAGKAIEDLLTINSYLQAVNDHLEECGHADRLTAADLPEGTTRSKAVETWCKTRRIKAGKTAIASRLVNNPQMIQLEPAAVDYLKDLHAKLTEILKP